MKKDKAAKNSAVHFRLSEDFVRQLDLLAQSCGRSKTALAFYLLEVMLGVVQHKPRLHLDFGGIEAGHTREMNIRLPEDWHDLLFHIAGTYGLNVSALVRGFLITALEYYQRLVPEGRSLRKEDFKQLVIREFEFRESRIN